MATQLVKVTAVGYYEIDSENIAENYDGALTFEAAVQKQDEWNREGEWSFEELVSDDHPMTIKLEMVDAVDSAPEETAAAQ